jgi:hypothetical protein
MANVVFNLNAEEGDAVRGFLRLVEAQKKSEKGLDRNIRKAKQLDKGLAGIGKAAKGLLPVLGVGGALTKGLAAGLRILQDYDRFLDDINRRTSALTGTLAAFTLVQPAGLAAQNQIQAARAGARFGVAPQQALSSVQALQSATGSFQRGLQGATALFQAQNLGVGIEDAQNVAFAALAKQAQGEEISPREAIAINVLAGNASTFSPAQLAKTFKALPFVGGEQSTALSFAAAVPLSARFGAEEFQTFLKNAGVTITREPTGALQQVFRREGVEEGDFVGRLRALQRAGITTQAELGKVGIKEQRAAAGLEAILQNLDSILENAAKFRAQARDPEFLQKEIGRVSEENIQFRQAQERARIRAEREVEEIFGAVGVRAGVTGITEERIKTAVSDIPLLRGAVGEEVGFFDRFAARLFPSIRQEERTTRQRALLQRRELGTITPGEEEELEFSLGVSVAEARGVSRFGAGRALTAQRIRVSAEERGLSPEERIEALIAALERNTEATEAATGGAVAPRRDVD